MVVNGKAASVYYISPAQVNIIAPDDTAVGTVSIQIQTPFGLTNMAFVERARVSPTLHTAPSFAVGGSQHVIAQTQDFRSFVGFPSMIPGLPFAAAKPGEMVIVYALGCGPTTPITPAGIVATDAAALALPYELRIGGKVADVRFGGIATNTVGLYQFNVVIPDLPTGEHPIELSVDGVRNAQNLVIYVGL